MPVARKKGTTKGHCRHRPVHGRDPFRRANRTLSLSVEALSYLNLLAKHDRSAREALDASIRPKKGGSQRRNASPRASGISTIRWATKCGRNTESARNWWRKPLPGIDQ